MSWFIWFTATCSIWHKTLLPKEKLMCSWGFGPSTSLPSSLLPSWFEIELILRLNGGVASSLLHSEKIRFSNEAHLSVHIWALFSQANLCCIWFYLVCTRCAIFVLWYLDFTSCFPKYRKTLHFANDKIKSFAYNWISLFI